MHPPRASSLSLAGSHLNGVARRRRAVAARVAVRSIAGEQAPRGRMAAGARPELQLRASLAALRASALGECISSAAAPIRLAPARPLAGGPRASAPQPQDGPIAARHSLPGLQPRPRSVDAAIARHIARPAPAARAPRRSSAPAWARPLPRCAPRAPASAPAPHDRSIERSVSGAPSRTAGRLGAAANHPGPSCGAAERPVSPAAGLLLLLSCASAQRTCMSTSIAKTDALPVQGNASANQTVVDDQGLQASRCRLWQITQQQIEAAGCSAAKGRCAAGPPGRPSRARALPASARALPEPRPCALPLSPACCPQLPARGVLAHAHEQGPQLDRGHHHRRAHLRPVRDGGQGRGAAGGARAPAPTTGAQAAARAGAGAGARSRRWHAARLQGEAAVPGAPAAERRPAPARWRSTAAAAARWCGRCTRHPRATRRAAGSRPTATPTPTPTSTRAPTTASSCRWTPSAPPPPTPTGEGAACADGALGHRGWLQLEQGAKG